MIFAVVFMVALALALALTPAAIRLAHRFGGLDQPAPRRIHQAPTPRFGGLPLWVAFTTALLISFVYPRSDPAELPRLLGLVLGSALLFAAGIIDDRRELGPAPQLLVQLAAAGCAVGAGVLIAELPNPLGGPPIVLPLWLAVGFTFFWIVGMVNTINWIDGLDGLAAGVTLVAGCVLLIHTLRLEQYSLALPPLALLGAVLGVLYFNLPPARLFLGGGAPLLGLWLAVLSILGGAKVASALLVLLVPILDVAWQILRRVRAGRSPFHADRGHLHHRLLDAGWSPRQVILLYYALSAALGALALLLPSGSYKLMALVLVGLGAAAFLLRLEWK